MKKILWLPLFLLIATSSFADRTGTIISAPVTPGNSANTFPSAYCDEIAGCNQSVADLTARNAIPAARRVEGMTVYVISTATTYRLLGGILDANWAVSGDSPSVGWSLDGDSVYVSDITNNVGIGTAEPSSKLYVAGAGNFTSTVTAGGFDQSLSGSNFKIDLYEGDPGVLTLQGIGNSNNGSLTIDTESRETTIKFGSSSGATMYDFPETVRINRIFAGGVDTGAALSVSDGIVSYYKMEDAINDGSVTDEQATNGGVLQNGNTGDITIQAKLGYGLNLNGTNQYIDLGSGASLKPTSAFSYAQWIKTTQTATGRIAGNRSSGGTNVGWEAVLVSGQLRCFGDVGSTSAQAQSSTLINDGTDKFIVCTWDGTSIKAYVNGVMEESIGLSGDIGTGAGNTFLGRTPNTANYTAAVYDNVQIFDDSLTQEEITFLYNGGNGRETLSGGGTETAANVIGTSSAVVSGHSLNTKADLIVEHDLEIQNSLYLKEGSISTDLTGGTFTECWSQDGGLVCSVDADGVTDGN